MNTKVAGSICMSTAGYSPNGRANSDIHPFWVSKSSTSFGGVSMWKFSHLSTQHQQRSSDLTIPFQKPSFSLTQVALRVPRFGASDPREVSVVVNAVKALLLTFLPPRRNGQDE